MLFNSEVNNSMKCSSYIKQNYSFDRNNLVRLFNLNCKNYAVFILLLLSMQIKHGIA